MGVAGSQHAEGAAGDSRKERTGARFVLLPLTQHACPTVSDATKTIAAEQPGACRAVPDVGRSARLAHGRAAAT